MSKRESDRQAAEDRAQSVRNRIDQGKTIAQIMAENQAKISRALLAKALEEK